MWNCDHGWVCSSWLPMRCFGWSNTTEGCSGSVCALCCLGTKLWIYGFLEGQWVHFIAWKFSIDLLYYIHTLHTCYYVFIYALHLAPKHKNNPQCLHNHLAIHSDSILYTQLTQRVHVSHPRYFPHARTSIVLPAEYPVVSRGCCLSHK